MSLNGYLGVTPETQKKMSQHIVVHVQLFHKTFKCCLSFGYLFLFIRLPKNHLPLSLLLSHSISFFISVIMLFNCQISIVFFLIFFIDLLYLMRILCDSCFQLLKYGFVQFFEHTYNNCFEAGLLRLGIAHVERFFIDCLFGIQIILSCFYALYLFFINNQTF